MFLGFSGTSLKWIVSYGEKNHQHKIHINAVGTIPYITTKNKKSLPGEFTTWLKKSNIHYILPAGTCTHTLTTEVFTHDQVKSEAPGFVVHQKTLGKSRGTDIYMTTSIYMEQVKNDMNMLGYLGIIPASVHHVSAGMSFRDNHLSNPATLIIYIGEVSCFISWVANGNILYQQDMMIGTEELIKTISEMVNVSDEYAKDILYKYGITRSHPNPDVFPALTKVLQPISTLIQEWVTNYAKYTYLPKNLASHPGIIYVYGPGSKIPGIEQYLVLHTGIITENISEKILQDYVLEKGISTDDIAPYESLVIQSNMIPTK